ncbi:MAG TPA: hypothetical protein VG711_07165 [Phycisphaerales bacterium]|nr:hypothetical protein [Phycisphaerales bacterium]
MHRKVRRTKSPAGNVLVFVLLAVAMTFLLGLTYLNTCTSVTNVADVLEDHSRARQVAESAINSTIEYVRSNGDWRSQEPSGTWISDMSLLDGTVTVTGTYSPEVDVAVTNASFESAVGQLANPLIAPPMSGTVGGWELTRTALVQTGTTVPKVGVEASVDSTDGANRAFITFTLSVIGTAQIARTLGESLESACTYRCIVDVTPTGFPALSSEIGFRILAGGVVVASTTHASTLQLPSLPSELPDLPSSLPSGQEVDSLLEVLGLGPGGASEYALTFTTTESPPAGNIRIEIYANSIGVLAGVRFDNVQIYKESTPLVLTAVSQAGAASYQVSASVIRQLDASSNPYVRIVQWQESIE